MPNEIFPCPFCGRRMGVGVDSLGKKVRCPHCKQVVLAPAPKLPAPPPVPVVPPPVPDDPASDEVSVYTFPKREAHDSILGNPEEDDGGDEVFSSSPAIRVPVVDAPEREPPAPPVPVPIPVAPVVVPVVVTEVPATVANPWAAMEEIGSLPTVQPIPVEVDELPKEPRRERKSHRERARAAPAGAGGAMLFKIGFFVLLPYALLMTGLAVYGLFFKTAKVETGHPLSTIPDNFGEFPPAERRKVGKLGVPLDGPLPPELKVALGEKLQVGAVEVEPVRVEVRPLKIVTTAKTGDERVERVTRPAVVLQLKVRNISDDLTIHPMDPAFTRLARPGDQPATGLIVGNQAFWGGAIGWPPANSRIGREYEEGQEADAAPLRPGESREYVVFSDTNPKVVKAVQEAREGLLWRVQIRRGFVTYLGKDVPVTAVFGVEFRSADVKEGE